MKIQRHYHVDETLQRSSVQKSPHSYRRLVHWVNPDGTLGNRLETPRWESFYCGKYQPVTADVAAELERQFIDTLIKDNQK
jgi:hypothetical protein